MNSVPAKPEPPTLPEGWRQRFIQDLFHRLGQPMTALHCSIELALRRELSVSEHREVLVEALALTTLLIDITKSERELADSTDPGNPEITNLSSLAGSVADEFRPVLEEQGVSLFIETRSSARIVVDAGRIRRVLYALFDISIQGGRVESLLLFVTPMDSNALLYLGPTVSYLGRVEARLEPSPWMRSAALIANYVRTARGQIDILRIPNGPKFLLRFPLYTDSEVVSAESSMNFTE